MTTSGLNVSNDWLGAVLAEAERLYAERNPTSGTLYQRAQAVMPGGNTRTALHFDPFPLYMTSSAGSTVTDADGHEYVDVHGEFSAGLFGHKHPVITDAVRSVLDNGFSNGGPGEAEIKLAELVCARFPSIETVRFCNSGTEANLYALTLAKAFTGRKTVLVFSHGYHGGVLAFPNANNPMNVPMDFIIAPYNDGEEVTRLFAERGRELAAVIIEPMMSSGGCIVADTNFLALLRRKCTETGTILVFDEIVTSRMGFGGMQAMTGIIPDMTTLGKYIGGGFSAGAFGGRADIMAQMDPTRPNALVHAGTFNNNLFTMTAGSTALETVFTREAAEALFESGERLRAMLNATFLASGIPAQAIGLGSIMNIHFTARTIRRPEDTFAADKRLYALLQLDLIEQGIYIARRGQIILSLPMTDDQIDKVHQAVTLFATRRKNLFDQTLGV